MTPVPKHRSAGPHFFRRGPHRSHSSRRAVPRASVADRADSRAQLCPPANPIHPCLHRHRRGHRHRPDARGAARLRVGAQLDLGQHRSARRAAMDAALPRRGARRADADRGGDLVRAYATRAARRARACDGGRLPHVALFQILSTFALLNGATSRVIILAYSMPIWTTIMGRLLLGERLTTMRQIAIALCIVGLAILVWPLFAHGIPITVVLGLACAWCWCGRHRLPEMGEGDCAAARQRGLATRVRLPVHRRRHVHLRGRATCERDIPRHLARHPVHGHHRYGACSFPVVVGRPPDCRRSPPRSARCWCR